MRRIPIFKIIILLIFASTKNVVSEIMFLPEGRSILGSVNEISIKDAVRKARSGSDVESKYVLGLMLFYGMGEELDRNIDRAIDSFREASIEGHVKSQRNLAILLWNQNKTSSAEVWMRRAASNDDEHAQWMLGHMLYKNKNFKEAFEWFERASLNPQAMHYLGILHEYGLGTPRDYSKAVAAYEKGNELGNRDSTFHLGLIYANGRSETIPQDSVKAGLLFKQCADANHPACLFYLARMCLEGKIYSDDNTIRVDYEMAQYYLLRSIRFSNNSSKYLYITDKATNLLSKIQSIIQGTSRSISETQRKYVERGRTRKHAGL
jgi:TPR repeat protein